MLAACVGAMLERGTNAKSACTPTLATIAFLRLVARVELVVLRSVVLRSAARLLIAKGHKDSCVALMRWLHAFIPGSRAASNASRRSRNAASPSQTASRKGDRLSSGFPRASVNNADSRSDRMTWMIFHQALLITAASIIGS